MREISLQEADAVGGSWSWVSYVISQGVTYAIGAAWRGEVDYAGVAEAQGHYYNMVGA